MRRAGTDRQRRVRERDRLERVCVEDVPQPRRRRAVGPGVPGGSSRRRACWMRWATNARRVSASSASSAQPSASWSRETSPEVARRRSTAGRPPAPSAFHPARSARGRRPASGSRQASPGGRRGRRPAAARRPSTARRRARACRGRTGRPLRRRGRASRRRGCGAGRRASRRTRVSASRTPATDGLPRDHGRAIQRERSHRRIVQDRCRGGRLRSGDGHAPRPDRVLDRQLGHARSEQRPAAGVRFDVRVPAHGAAHPGHGGRDRGHGAGGGRRPWRS